MSHPDLRLALVVGLIGLAACVEPDDTAASPDPTDDGATSPGDRATSDSALDAAIANDGDDRGPVPDRDSAVESDGGSGDGGSGDGAVEPSLVTITRTLPDVDRVYVKDTLQIQFLVDGADDDAEIVPDTPALSRGRRRKASSNEIVVSRA